eukprot:2089961-Amphidinium_carterae.1
MSRTWCRQANRGVVMGLPLLHLLCFDKDCLAILAREYSRLEQRCQSLESSLGKVLWERTRAVELWLLGVSDFA